MIYLIITASINNLHGYENNKEREDRYKYAINETLKHVPSEIKPLIVENNGKRESFFDYFYQNRNHIKVIYTENNKFKFKSKGINEMLDIKEVIQKYGIEDEDIIIKLTGRYRILSSKFFEEIIENQNNYDAFVKFFGTCSQKFEKYDCILGCYAIRAKFLKMFNHLSIDNYNSAEIAFARYVKFCGARIKEIEQIDVECCFAENNRILIV
jgi:hypothetical protein